MNINHNINNYDDDNDFKKLKSNHIRAFFF